MAAAGLYVNIWIGYAEYIVKEAGEYAESIMYPAAGIRFRAL